MSAWEVAPIREVHAILITGRTLKQGMGVAEGKDSDVYREETGQVELSAGTMAKLDLKQSDSVEILTDSGVGRFLCRVADLPDDVVFVPYGPPANKLTLYETEGSGMPGFKGIPCRVRRAIDEDI
jgi:formylmethanofuran dehydrogenase subunit D